MENQEKKIEDQIRRTEEQLKKLKEKKARIKKRELEKKKRETRQWYSDLNQKIDALLIRIFGDGYMEAVRKEDIIAVLSKEFTGKTQIEEEEANTSEN